MKQRFITLLCGLLSLMLVVLAGCQSVGGVDLDKVLSNGLNVQSYEGTQTISIDLMLNDQAAAAPGQPDLSVLKNLTLAFSSVKMQDPEHVSMAGELRYANGAIPIELSIDGQQAALLVEGASKPVVLDLSMNAMMAGAEGEAGLVGSLPINTSGLDDPSKLIKSVAPLLFKFLPNPGTVQVDSVKEAINGETLDLKKVHVEIKGSEVGGLLKQLLDNLLADEQGLLDLITVVMKEAMGDEYSPIVGAFAAGFVQEMLGGFAANLDAELAKEPLKQILTDSNGIKLDLFVDADSNIRKADYELAFTIPSETGAMEGIKVSGGMDLWNLNKPVTADMIDTKNALEVGPGKTAGMAHFLKTLDPNSQAYKFLMEDLKVTRKNIAMAMGDGLPGADEIRPYIDPVTEKTMVPVRFVSESLDAEVKWNGEKQQVTVVDLLSGKTLLFTLGSKTVLVDGAAVEIEASATLTGNSTYVPVRFIAESFGAEVGWDDATRTVSIIRN